MKNNSRDPRLKRGKKENARHTRQAKHSAKKRKERVLYDSGWKKDCHNNNYE